jgi:hypothetical protein
MIYLLSIWDNSFSRTITHITNLSNTIQFASLRVVERARVWSKPFTIECCEGHRLEKPVFATPAARFRRQKASQKVEKFELSTHIRNFQAIFYLSSKNSFYKDYFFIYLLCFKSSSHRRRDTAHLYLFICFRQLLKFAEISFASICVSAIFERIKLSQRLRIEKNSR